MVYSLFHFEILLCYNLFIDKFSYYSYSSEVL